MLRPLSTVDNFTPKMFELLSAKRCAFQEATNKFQCPICEVNLVHSTSCTTHFPILRQCLRSLKTHTRIACSTFVCQSKGCPQTVPTNAVVKNIITLLVLVFRSLGTEFKTLLHRTCTLWAFLWKYAISHTSNTCHFLRIATRECIATGAFVFLCNSWKTDETSEQSPGTPKFPCN